MGPHRQDGFDQLSSGGSRCSRWSHAGIWGKNNRHSHCWEAAKLERSRHTNIQPRGYRSSPRCIVNRGFASDLFWQQMARLSSRATEGTGLRGSERLLNTGALVECNNYSGSPRGRISHCGKGLTWQALQDDWTDHTDFRYRSSVHRDSSIDRRCRLPRSKETSPCVFL
jgi:hypothetical protein